ncbi:hypothetical protein FDK13_11990 [Dyadobacter frigoris]|uniref:Uncharacterized protein n=1 Tax=Dyadobacter frigoris TaxID=2576211 RepID=A0A4U6D633_9BACT|nr:hypothetical protein FDK13_11990 [Dyadobacter frigoris]
MVLALLFGLTFLSKSLQKFRDFLGLGLIIVPVGYFYIILSAHVINVPYEDDYNLLETIYNLKNGSGFTNTAKILFEQVNQHRFAFERIVMLIMVFFTGTVDIKLQVMLGNLFMLGILYLFFLTFKKEKVSWYYFIPVPYILFNLVYFENAIWGIAAIQNTPLLFFAMLTVYFIGKPDKRSWIFAVLAAIVTMFISGSGMLTWIIGGVILLFQKRYKLLAQWIGIAIVFILFYFLFDYQFVSTGHGKVWEHPIFNLIFIFGFWGNALYLDIPHPLTPVFYKDMVLCVFLGMGIFAVFLGWITRMFLNKNMPWTNWFLLGAFMFLMGTGAMFIVSRPSGNFLMYGGNIFSRRYMIFGVVLLAIAYVGLILIVKNYKNISLSVFVLSLVGCLALNFVSYFYSIRSVREQHEKLSLDAYYWKNYNTLLSVGFNYGDKPFWNHPTKMKNLINNLEKQGLLHLYETDKLPPANRLIQETEKVDEYAPKLNIQLSIRNNDDNMPIRYIKFETKKRMHPKPAYFVLVSDQYTNLLPAIPVPNSLSDFLKKRTYYGEKYSYSFYKRKVPKGKFDIWILSGGEKDSGKWESRYTREKIFIF